MTQNRKPTKIETLRVMLTTEAGITLAQICAEMGWQTHSARAALSGLRKAGFAVERGAAADGSSDSVYRIVRRTTEAMAGQ